MSLVTHYNIVFILPICSFLLVVCLIDLVVVWLGSFRIPLSHVSLIIWCSVISVLNLCLF